jgi:hypothetical protein
VSSSRVSCAPLLRWSMEEPDNNNNNNPTA